MTSHSVASPVSEEFSKSGSYTLSKYDILTVFQAAPLAYFDVNDEPHPIGMLDFELERDILSDVVGEARRNDAHIELAFETATTDRLGAFLARGECEVLHFSCHGHPDYLFVEDGWGAGYQLLVPDLQDWIIKGGSNLRFVFVSACHSRSAGEAFLAAGVPHVVCCQQDNQEVRNTAAIEFARSFYRALVCGKSLQEAFDLGRHGVLHSRLVADAYNEMNKFVLLPDDENHNVPIFFTKPPPTTFSTKSWNSSTSTKHFPLPPQPFLGRDLEMFRVLNALKESRLVRVTGPAGSGKCSLVKAVCQYLCKRGMMEDVYWMPAENRKNCSNIVSWMLRLYEEFESESSAFRFKFDKTYSTCCDEIFDELHEKKALIIIDSRKLVLTESIRKLMSFLEDLFQLTRHTKVIVVHRLNQDIRSKYFSIIEDDIQIERLDFKSSVSLFCCHCRLVTDPEGLVDRLVAQHEANHCKMTYRTSEMLKLIGNGIPAEINNVARTMSPSEYDNFIALSSRPVLATYKTRASLELKLTSLREELAASIRLLDFDRAKQIQESLDEMEVQREALPDLQTLRMMAEGVSSDLDQAIFMKDFGTAGKLQKELDSLRDRIKLEIEDTPVGTPNSDEPTPDRSPALYQNTRIGLERCIQEQEAALEQACEQSNFANARAIDAKIVHMKLRKEKFLSAEQLRAQIGDLKSQKKEAMTNHNWDRVETLHQRIVDLEDKLKREQEAERGLNCGEVSNDNENSGNTCSSVNFASEEQETQRAQDPPGLYHNHYDTSTDQHNSAIEQLRRSTTSPSMRNDPGEAFESERKDPTLMWSVPPLLNAGVPLGVRPGAIAIPGPSNNDNETNNDEKSFLNAHMMQSCEEKSDSDKDTEDENTNKVPTSAGIGQRASVGVVKHNSDTAGSAGPSRPDLPGIDACSADDRAIVCDRVSCDTKVQGDMKPPAVPKHRLQQHSISPGPLGQVYEDVENKTSTKAKAWKRKGLCDRCGKVQTHVRKRTGLVWKNDPITSMDANGHYTVYKGFCLNPSCYTMDEAVAELEETTGDSRQTQRRFFVGKKKQAKRKQSEDEENLPVATVVAVKDHDDDASGITLDHNLVQEEKRWPTSGLNKKKGSGFVAASESTEKETSQNLPLAAFVVSDGEDSESSRNLDRKPAAKTKMEKQERAQIEKIIRETISSMTVTATKVEVVENDEHTEDGDENADVHKRKSK